MITYTSRLKQVEDYLLVGDLNLGYRKLLDAIYDTQDMLLFNKAIELTKWKENHLDQEQELKKNCISLLKELENYHVNSTSRDEYVIHANDVVKNYKSGNFTLGPVSLSISKGNVYGLVGENGNGKTTLLRILAKELSFQSGSINYNFSEMPTSDYDERSKLVYIPQRTQTWYGSLKDNLRFVLSNYQTLPEEIEPRMLFMIARLGLWNYQELKWSELSSGYKMRFELARTLLRSPEVMLLDEPLANLDVLAQQLILEDLISIGNSLSKPIAIILSSQQLYEVEKVSDKVIFLKNGKYTDNNFEDEATIDSPLIVEIETTGNREDLESIFSELRFEKLVNNGGVYLVYFPKNVSFSQVLATIGKSELSLIYIRDISKSTRRFFVS